MIPSEGSVTSMTFPDLPAFVSNGDDAPAYWFYGTLWVVLADVHQTGGSFSVMEQWMRPGFGPPAHVHTVDEWFFVLEGAMEMRINDRELVGKPGDSVWIPRGTAHAFSTGEDGAHVLNGYAPGGVEQIIAGLAVPAERRELPPEDLELPSADVFSRMLNNFWGNSADSPWTNVQPLR